MERQLNTINPSQQNIPATALIQKVVSQSDRLSNEEHEKAVQAFLHSDSIASGIGKDFAFVEKIPQLISDVIDNKSWECFYVFRGVVPPYYCCYTKGNDSENFKAFIAAKRPNGLGTTIETLDRLLEADLEVRNKFRLIIYQSRQGERTDLVTSGLQVPKLELGGRHQKRIRATERAAEAIPEIRELLDRGLIAIDIAAKLGRDIKDPDNFTAEEREYIDKRDLVGLRIKQYINTNTIPEDEDQEPAYSRKLNSFVQDLLGIKNRSKSVRMDDPQKAAKKLLQFYQGEKLKKLLQHLATGLDSTDIQSIRVIQDISSTTDRDLFEVATPGDNRQTEAANTEKKPEKPTVPVSSSQISGKQKIENDKPITEQIHLSKEGKSLNTLELAKRLKVSRSSLNQNANKSAKKFEKWTEKKDPDGLAWQRNIENKERANIFSPIKEIDK